MALTGDTKVYRIIGIEGFMSILINKQERYVRPIDGWQDTFEGYMLHQLDTSTGRRKVLEKLYVLSGRDVNATIRNLSKLLRCRYACYGQCWSKNPDSDAMWRIYSYNQKAIQLITTVDDIQNMLEKSKWDDLEIEVDDVKYDIKDEKEAINKILVWNAKIDAAYFHKRPAFEHEAEVRVLLNDFKKYETEYAFDIKTIHKNMKKVDKSKNEIEQILDAVSYIDKDKSSYTPSVPMEIGLKIPNLGQYITGVRIHPQAPDWYVALIGEICRQYKISFLGRSDLYRPVV